MSGLGDFEHRTVDELNFLCGLGSYTLRPRRRVDLLRKYLTAAAHRVEWGRIDRRRAIAAAAAHLVREVQGIIP